MIQQKKILLIEDDKFLNRAYKDGLERAGFEISTAVDGVSGLEKMKAEKPNLVLLDLVMPGKNGFEVLEEMRMDEELKDIRVVILSNLGQETDVRKGKELGAVDYLIKTDWSMREVVEKVKYHLAKT